MNFYAFSQKHRFIGFCQIWNRLLQELAKRQNAKTVLFWMSWWLTISVVARYCNVNVVTCANTNVELDNRIRFYESFALALLVSEEIQMRGKGGTNVCIAMNERTKNDDWKPWRLSARDRQTDRQPTNQPVSHPISQPVSPLTSPMANWLLSRLANLSIGNL